MTGARDVKKRFKLVINFLSISPCNTTTEMFSNFGADSNTEHKEFDGEVDYRQYDDDNGRF